MSTFKLWIVNKLFAFLPPTRFYKIKSILLSWAGANISKTARIVSSAHIVGHGDLKIGNDTFVGHEVFISCSPPGIEIGAFVDIAPKVSIINGTHEIDMEGNHAAGRGKSLPIIIKNGVWIGAGSIILPGVTIGEKAVIGSGSVVSSDIPPYTLSVGAPCQPIKGWDSKKAKLIVVSKDN